MLSPDVEWAARPQRIWIGNDLKNFISLEFHKMGGHRGFALIWEESSVKKKQCGWLEKVGVCGEGNEGRKPSKMETFDSISMNEVEEGLSKIGCG